MCQLVVWIVNPDVQRVFMAQWLKRRTKDREFSGSSLTRANFSIVYLFIFHLIQFIWHVLYNFDKKMEWNIIMWIKLNWIRISNGNARAWLHLLYGTPFRNFVKSMYMPDLITENSMRFDNSSGSAFQQSTARLVKQLSRCLLINTCLRSLQPCS